MSGQRPTARISILACLSVILCGVVYSGATAQSGKQKDQEVQPIPIAEIKRDKPVSFFEEVLPILEEKCLACHSVSLAEGNLNLEEVSTMLKGGKRGPAIVPGRGADSLLIKVAARQMEPYMPPPDRKDYPPLTPEELGLIKLWIDQGAKDDTEEGEAEAIELRPLPPQLNAILAVELSPDGRFVAAGRGNRVQVYDVESGTLVVDLVGHLDYVQSLAWSPDSRLLASGSYRLVKVWRAPFPSPRGYLVDPVHGRGVTAHVGPVTDAVVLEDGKRVVTASGDGWIKIWDSEQRTLLASAQSPLGAVSAIAPVPGTTRLLVAGGDKVALMETRDWSVQRVWTVGRPVRCLAVAPDGRRLAVGTDQGTAHVFRLPFVDVQEKPLQPGGQLVGRTDQGAIVLAGGKVISLDAEGAARELFDVGGTAGAVSLSPDGKHAAYIDQQGRLHIRAIAGSQEATLGSDKEATSFVWLPDGKLLVAMATPSLELITVTPQENKPPVLSVSSSRPLPAIARWTVAANPQTVLVVLENGQIMATSGELAEPQKIAEIGAAPRDVAISDDGKRLAVLTENGKLFLLDVEARKPREVATVTNARAMAIAPAGDHLLVSDGASLRLLDVASGQPLFRAPLGIEEPERVLPLTDGRFLVQGAGGVYAVTADPGSQISATATSGAACVAVEFGPRGEELLVALANGSFTACDPLTGKVLRSQRSPGGELRDLAVSPLGNLIVTAMADKQAYVWNYGDLSPYPQAGANQRKLAGFNTPLRRARFLPDGTGVVLSSDDGTVRMYEVASGRLVHEFPGATTTVFALLPLRDNVLITGAGDGTVQLWDWTLEWSEQYQITGIFAHRVLALDFSPDGRFLATGGGEPSRSGEIKLFDAESGTLVREFPEPHTDTVFGIDFSPDGTMLASSSADKLAKVFDLASGQELRKLEGHTHHVLDVVWRWDGQRIVTCGADNVLKVWDVRTGEQIRTIGGHSKQVTGLAAVPRTNDVISCGADAQVRRYNTDNGGTVRTYGGAGDYLYGVSVDQNGRWVAAGGQQSILFIWRLDNGQLVHRIGPPPAREVAARQTP